MDDRRNFNTSHVTVYLKRDDCDFCSTIFQYISCYCLSFCSLPPFSVGVDFNTSHVTVYLIRSHIIINSIYISIHLMLLFILLEFDLALVFPTFQYISCYCLSSSLMSKKKRMNHFNTSHVTVYLRQLRTLSESRVDFNTSHVTVYRLMHQNGVWIMVFQYISCYCLSSIFIRLSSILRYFNTSHVTVYRGQLLTEPIKTIFQYISCYCLSAERRSNRVVRSAFQYISCYCLSTPHNPVTVPYPVFQYISCYCLSHFGTPDLMLLYRFQYISCYCLSLTALACSTQFLSFQYISCYCLSKHHSNDSLSLQHFNTSHVTVYLTS